MVLCKICALGGDSRNSGAGTRVATIARSFIHQGSIRCFNPTRPRSGKDSKAFLRISGYAPAPVFQKRGYVSKFCRSRIETLPTAPGTDARSRVLLDDGAPHSEDCAFALKSAAALAVSNVPAGPLAITSCDPVTRFSPTADLRCWHAVLREHQRPSDTGPNRGLGRQGKATGAIRRQPFLPYRPIGSCSRSSASLFTRRSRPAHRAR